MSRAPDKGSFPLDHFHECDEEAKIYSQCVAKHQLIPKKCRQAQMNYLSCRMKSGLMEHQEMEKLGFVKETSWESEEAEQRFLFEKIQQQKRQAWEAALKQAQRLKKQQKPQQAPQTKLPEIPQPQ